ncbi:CDP-alcohol phosphatidyltransferase family protein [Pseudomonas sp. UV AK001]|uniref:CDP-alcohol phosphatidyltransferase family protein n=1 Tax=Pseudomonas sp. UV AK001 TaxID=3384791 RepID=UPI0038D3EF6C
MTMQVGSKSPKYQYCCVDQSALAHWLSTKIAPYVDERLPPCMSPDQVTYLAALFAVTMTIGVYLTPSGWTTFMLPVWGGMSWMYCILDHVDGVRARNLGRSSAWGEFLDHGIDSGVVSLVVVSILMCGAAKEVNAITAVFFLCTVGLATVMVWLGQYTSGRLSLPVLGPVEGVFVASMYMLACMFSTLNRGLSFEVLPGLLVMDVVLIVVSTVILGAVAWRSIRAPRDMRFALPFLIGCLLMISTVASNVSSLFLVLWLSALGTMHHAAVIIVAHLMQSTISPGYQVSVVIFPLIVFVFFWLSLPGADWLWVVPCCVAISLIRVWVQARQYLY